jgi:hypothetical protein
VAIHNLVGDLTVVPTAGASVVAEITLRGRDAARLRVIDGALRGGTVLRIVYPGHRILASATDGGRAGGKRWGHRYQSTFWVRDDGTLDGNAGEGHRVTISDRGSGLEASADVRLMVPRGRNVSVFWGHGRGDARGVDADLRIDGAGFEVSAREFKGSLHVDVGSGGVRVTDAAGLLRVETGSGDVTVSDLRGETVSIATGSGAIDATGVDAREISLDTGSGDIRAERIRAARAHLDTGSGRIQVEMVRDVESLLVDTGSGDVSIVVPGGAGASFRAETASGTIDSDLPMEVTKRSRGFLAGTIGDGRGRIAVETGSGDISFRRAR